MLHLNTIYKVICNMSTINRFIQNELSGNVLVRIADITYAYYNADDDVLFKVHVDCLGRAVRHELKTMLPNRTTYSGLLALVGQHKMASVRCTIEQLH